MKGHDFVSRLLHFLVFSHSPVCIWRLQAGGAVISKVAERKVYKEVESGRESSTSINWDIILKQNAWEGLFHTYLWKKISYAKRAAFSYQYIFVNSEQTCVEFSVVHAQRTSKSAYLQNIWSSFFASKDAQCAHAKFSPSKYLLLWKRRQRYAESFAIHSVPSSQDSASECSTRYAYAHTNQRKSDKRMKKTLLLYKKYTYIHLQRKSCRLTLIQFGFP